MQPDDPSWNETSIEEAGLARQAFELAAIGMAYICREGRLIWANETFRRMTGYERSELDGLSIGCLLAGKAGPSSSEPLEWRTPTSEDADYVTEMKLIRKDGHERWAEVRVSKPIESRMQASRLVQLTDITEQKRLKEANELLESLFDSNLDGIDIVDLTRNFIRVNEAFERIYGWSANELVQIGFPIIPPGKTEEFEELALRVWKGEHIHNFETVRQRKDGKLIDVSLSAFSIYDDTGEMTAYACISRDITERKQTEEFLRKSDKLNMVGHLAAGIAHEIRNPLTAMRGFMQLMQEGHGGKREFYEIMLSELDRINSIVNEFLLIAKPETGRFVTVYAEEILKHVIVLLDSEANLRDVRISLDLKALAIELRCSEMQIKQVFINLLKNAIEAMPNGGEVYVGVDSPKHGWVRFRIKDQGVGIPENRMKKLGEPFYSTKEKGTGLGLMMCFKIIEAHRGHLNFYSKPGAGTTVEILLPSHD